MRASYGLKEVSITMDRANFYIYIWNKYVYGREGSKPQTGDATLDPLRSGDNMPDETLVKIQLDYKIMFREYTFRKSSVKLFLFSPYCAKIC